MMRKRSKSIFFFVLMVSFVFLTLPSPADALIYGLESCATGGSPCTGGTGTSASSAPTNLFSFAEDGSSLSFINTVKIGSTEIDADALALSANYGMLAYQITGGAVAEASKSSQLISIDPTTALATTIGSAFSTPNRNIRAAVFDLYDRLWVIDAIANASGSSELLRINPTTGAVIGSTGLTLGGSPYAIGAFGSDLAITQSGTFYLVDFDTTAGRSKIYTLDIGTGALTQVFVDNVFDDLNATFLIGAAFSEAGANPLDLFTLEVNSVDDIFKYEVGNSFARTELYSNIVSGSVFNAGRGDLASLMTPIPEPATLLLLGTGLIGLGLTRRRRRIM